MVTVKVERAEAYELWGLLFSDAVDNFFILDGEGIRRKSDVVGTFVTDSLLRPN